MKLLSPRLDVVFKKLFAEPDNRPLLTDFLSCVLDVEPERIKNIIIENSEITPMMINDKFIRLDLTLSIDGAKIDIEMQCLGNRAYRDRALYYWAKLYARDLRSGESYSNLEPTISINICNFDMFECEEYHSTFELYERNRHEKLTDKCRIDFLELKKARGENSRQIRRLERWMRFFNINSEEEAEMVAKLDATMEQAILALRAMSSDTLARQMAEMREAHLHDEATALESAREEGREKGIEEGIAKGREEGIAEGIAKGREEGREEGRTEGINAGQQMIIERMRRAGMTEEQIKGVLSIEIE